MSQDLMNYDKMTQLALRGVVRDAIRRVIREGGLPGAHHFYITFLTRFPGVEIDESLSKKYPEEVTIVLEHQYWDLKAHDDSFEVTLKFGGVPKYLHVPYTAISRFHDPSVGFAMQFDPPEEMAETNANEEQSQPRAPLTLAKLHPEPSSQSGAEPKSKSEAKPASKAVKPVTKSLAKPEAKPASKSTSKPNGKPEKAAQKDTKKKAAPKSKDVPIKEDKNKVVSLDAFRKK